MLRRSTFFSFLGIFTFAASCGGKSQFLSKSDQVKKSENNPSEVASGRAKAEGEKFDQSSPDPSATREHTEDSGSPRAAKPFGTPDDGKSPGLVGTIYDFQGNKHKTLPNFSELPQKGKIRLTHFDIPERNFEDGFPGLPDLVEYFGIGFEGKLLIEKEGLYEFTLASDDGSKLYVNDKLIVNNDGYHMMSTEKSGKIELAKGTHKFQLDYFQGPRVQIGLQLFWKKPGQSEREIVPAAAFDRPDASLSLNAQQ